MTNGPLEIRLFKPADRNAVRRLCVTNATDARANSLPDDHVFADYWLNYYMNKEPQHFWVAMRGSELAGYAACAFDTFAFRKAMNRRVVPLIYLKALSSGRIFRGPVREFLRRRRPLWRSEPPVGVEVARRFPAHVHINVAAAARGLDVGSRLLKTAADAARDAGCAGLHAEIHPANEPARQFFLGMGFHEVGRHRLFPHEPETSGEPRILVLGKELR